MAGSFRIEVDFATHFYDVSVARFMGTEHNRGCL